MPKNRKQINKPIKEKILKEYNYRCAIDNSENPHIHHIDGDPSNNDIMNLIPLCPNCHLNDQHDPTKKIEIEKLRWFRKYKDPTILKPQFHPLYLRLLFLNSIDENSNVEDLVYKTEELVNFIENLEMGNFYAKRIWEITKKPPYYQIAVIDSYESDLRNEQESLKLDKEYLEQIIKNKEIVFTLVFELLRYQKWD